MRLLLSLTMMVCIGMILVLQACNRKPLPAIQTTDNVTFSAHIQPITKSICIECHSKGTRDYSEYMNAYRMRHSIYHRVVIDKSMPMGKNLTNEERALFRDWVDQGGRE